MLKNSYSKEFENAMYKFGPTKSLTELHNIAIKDFKYKITRDQLRQYLSKRKIRYTDYATRNVRDMAKYKPGDTFTKKSDGMTLIRLEDGSWEYKQRYIYEQYHKVKLTNKDYVIFMDGDRNNFAIENLKCVPCRVASIIGNMRLPAKNKEIMESALALAELTVEVYELENKKPTSHKRKKVQ